MTRSPSHSDQHAEKGAIVVIVLLILAVISFLAMELSKETLIDHTSSVYLKSTITTNTLCDSGLLLAQDILVNDLDETKSDHYFETWGKLETPLKELSQELKSGELTGSIEDENSLFPINNISTKDSSSTEVAKAYQDIFLRLLTQLCKDLDITANPEKYMSAIRRWQGDTLPNIDEEDAWYKSQPEEYSRPKKALSSTSELLLIFWEGADEGDVELLYNGDDSTPGLKDLISVYAEGTINMNTAHDYIVRAVPATEGDTDEFLLAVNNYRNDIANDFATTWYVTIASFVGIPREKMPEKALGFTSNRFRVKITATSGSGEKTETTILSRTKEKTTTLATAGQ